MLKAIQDALNQKIQYETLKDKIQSKQRDLQLELSRILAGKKSLISIFKRTPKEIQTQEIENKILQCSKDYENVQFICDIISVILGYFEIIKFQKKKSENYFNLFKKLSEIEGEKEIKIREYWEKLRQISKNYNFVE